MKSVRKQRQGNRPQRHNSDYSRRFARVDDDSRSKGRFGRDWTTRMSVSAQGVALISGAARTDDANFRVEAMARDRH